MGTLLAALFLSLIDNVLPLFHQPTEYAQITIGALILLYVLSRPRLPIRIARLRTSWGGVGRLQISETKPRASRASPRARAGSAARGSASRPITTQIACTASPPIVHNRCGADESNAIEPPGPSS